MTLHVERGMERRGVEERKAAGRLRICLINDLADLSVALAGRRDRSLILFRGTNGWLCLPLMLYVGRHAQGLSNE